MPKRQVFHVVPNPKGGWDVKKQGGQRATSHADTKAEAVGRAKDLAKRAALGQVIIHKQDGTIQAEHTYGADPRSSPG